MNVFEPWILARLAAGIVATALFLRAAIVGLRVLRSLRVASTAEGQLALERQAELASSSLRVGAGISVLGLLLSLAAADRLVPDLRGAMCGYGVVHANGFGPFSIAATIATAVSAGVVLRVLALDRSLREPLLFRPVALLSIAVAACSVVDLALVSGWLGTLDFSVVASCCSTSLDEGGAGDSLRGANGSGRVAVTLASVIGVGLSMIVARRAATKPGTTIAVAGGLATAIAVPLATLAVILEVAPHVYEVPRHMCGYCLLKADAWFIGYPLFAALFGSLVLAVGAAISALVTAKQASAEPFRSRFVGASFRSETWLLGVALVLGAFPVVRFAVVTGGASLFH